MDNFLPYGMALRALGQGLMVQMVGNSQILNAIGPYMGMKFSGHFSFCRWDEFPKDRIWEPGMYLLEDPPAELLDVNFLMDLKGMCSACSDTLEVAFFAREMADELVGSLDLVTKVHMTLNKRKEDSQPHIKLITGDGKGKTTYALGEALFYASQGIPSLVIQFIKSPREYGEVKASRQFRMLQIRSMGKGFPSNQKGSEDSIHEKACREAWRYFLSVLNRSSYGLVVLDEINIALRYGYLNINEVTQLLSNHSAPMSLLLTGRYANPALFPFVDYVIEMEEITHPYRKGIKARRGIEF